MLKNLSIDLHLHFDGSLSIENARALALIEGIRIPEDDGELCAMLTVSSDCANLGEYLTKFDFPLSLLQSEKSIEQGMYTLCKELADEGCIYAEIRFAPQLHMRKGLSQSEVVSAAIRGFARSSLRGGLILCCMRGDTNGDLNEQTVLASMEFLGKGVLALDLAGNEAAYPTDDFISLFSMAEKNNIPFTIHAGEAASAESVLSAIKMGARRIGHGVRACESSEAMSALARLSIPLELCPTSNLQTAVFNDISEYPIRSFMEKGICVTVNSDNRSVSATTAQKELELICNSFGFCEAEKRALLENSARASFADDGIKQELLNIIAERYM